MKNIIFGAENYLILDLKFGIYLNLNIFVKILKIKKNFEKN